MNIFIYHDGEFTYYNNNIMISILSKCKYFLKKKKELRTTQFGLATAKFCGKAKVLCRKEL